MPTKQAPSSAQPVKESKKPKSKKKESGALSNPNGSVAGAVAEGEAVSETKAKKGPPKPIKKSPTPEVVYPTVDVRMFHSDPKVMEGFSGEKGEGEPLTADIAKQLLGWKEESDNIKFGTNYLLKDRYGKKIRCLNNLTNRPFYSKLAEDWMLEILRKKWRFNGETIIADKFAMTHDGQHRLIGLVWADQEWEIDIKRGTADRADKNAPLEGWSTYWPDRPYIDALVVLGIESGDDVVNTIGTGKPRTLTDVLYRSKWFQGKTDRERFAAAKSLTWAVKLLWNRTRQDLSSYAPRRPHSESLEFIANHERLLECVAFIMDEAKGEKGDKLDEYSLSLGDSAGLLYLMGSAMSNSDTYDAVTNESALEWGLYDKAQEFWVQLCNNGKDVEALANKLLSIPAEAGGSYARDLRFALVIKAWNLFSDGKPVTEEDIEVDQELDGEGRPKVSETPRIGGIDVGDRNVTK